MKILMMRPEAHQTDTIARRLVPQAFPAMWEHRELTGRDYGIDMMFEIFEEGIPTGCFLSLQIKGTSHTIQEDVEKIKFDMPVNTLRYSELFIAPVLLVICPINDPKKRVFYLWLQEYINVALNYEKPNWRSKQNVRVTIPIENVVSKNIDKLQWIANSPKRNSEFLQLAQLHSKLSYDIRWYFNSNRLNHENCSLEPLIETESLLKDILRLISEMEKLENIFGDVKWHLEKFESILGGGKWHLPQVFLKERIQPAKATVLRLLKENNIPQKENDINFDTLLDSIPDLLEFCNDHGYSHLFWENNGSHDF